MKNDNNVASVEIPFEEKILDSTARFMFNVFNSKSGNYCEEFDNLLMSGGGGNSMFVNCWSKPSYHFVKKRISSEAKRVLRENNYSSLDEAPHSFKCNNAKGAEKRIAKGKRLHLDHNPGNVKVLEMIRTKCREYDPDKVEYQTIINDLKEFLRNIQTLDWITVEQDDIRTYGDEIHTKPEKDMMTHDERDELLNDTWEYLD